MKNQMEILQLLMLHTKPLLFFDKLDGYLRKFESIWYIVLFHFDEKYEFFDRIRYLIMLKSNISNEYSHKYKKTKINSGYNLSLQIYIKNAKCSNTD